MGPFVDDVRRYKPFIDGLRAVAILTVVCSHVGVPGLAGGYVGVDIFFVISGYLIIGQIEADVAAGRFSFLDFAARRALRILPAFLLVMITVLVLVSTVFLQFDYDDFSDSFLQSALMFSNHYFLSQQGYFDKAAFTRPLLHMWSLSVEEQFYLVAPLAIVTLYAATRRLSERAARRVRDVTAAVVALASFAACIVLTYGVSHNVAFYVMPARGWEFILGGNAAAAAPLLRRCPGRVIDLAALAGVAAIAFAVVSFDAATYYPTFRAAFPVLGTTAIIACGIAAPGNIVARALSVPPMVAIGLVSYAWYLWHWPLLSFLRTSDFTDTDLRKALGAAALALMLAALTYRFVEWPIRAWRRSVRPRSLPVTASMIAACVLTGTVGFAWSRYEAPRLLPQVTGLKPIALPPIALPQVTQRGLLLGDSHAAALAFPLRDYARRAGAELTLKTQMGCPPLVGVDVISGFGERITACNRYFGNIDFAGADFVIVAARWNFYLSLPWSDPFYRPTDLAAERADETAAPIALMRRGLTALIARIRQAGARRILLVGPVPEFPVDPPYCLVRALRLGTETCAIARGAVDARRAGAMAMLRDLAAEFAEVRVIDPIALFCTATACAPHSGRTLFYFDSSHMSPAGIDRFFHAFSSDFEWVFGAPGGIAAQAPPAAGRM